MVSRVLTSKLEEFEKKILNESAAELNKEESFENCDFEELKKIMHFRIIRNYQFDFFFTFLTKLFKTFSIFRFNVKNNLGKILN